MPAEAAQPIRRRSPLTGEGSMRTTRKATKRRNTAKKRPASIEAEVKRVARTAAVAVDTAAHDAKLALTRAGRDLKRTAKDLEARFEEVPAARRARRVQIKLMAAL